MDMLADLKLLLGITDDKKDDLLNFLINDCTYRALAYCKRRYMPEGMQSLIPVMAARAYRVCGYGKEAEEMTVISWKQGDRSETYGDGAVKRDDWINDFKDRLEPFRIRRGRLPSEVV